MGYRHTPLSSRLGISFNDASYWKVDMAQAECFMYFIAGLRQIFGDKDVLYIEGRRLDREVEAFYSSRSEPAARVMRLLQGPQARAYHIPLTRPNHKTLSRFAASKTFGALCGALCVYRDCEVIMDGSRISERVVLVGESVPEAKLKRFCATKIHASYEWVEEEGKFS